MPALEGAGKSSDPVKNADLARKLVNGGLGDHAVRGEQNVALWQIEHGGVARPLAHVDLLADDGVRLRIPAQGGTGRLSACAHRR